MKKTQISYFLGEFFLWATKRAETITYLLIFTAKALGHPSSSSNCILLRPLSLWCHQSTVPPKWFTVLHPHNSLYIHRLHQIFNIQKFISQNPDKIQQQQKKTRQPASFASRKYWFSCQCTLFQLYDCCGWKTASKPGLSEHRHPSAPDTPGRTWHCGGFPKN